MEKEQKRTKIAKKRMIDALRETLGVITPALETAEISHSAFYSWMDKDQEFKEEVERLEMEQLDTAEHALLKKIKAGDVTSIIFYLKTKGKKRGYVERQEITGVDGGPLQYEATKEFFED